MAERLEPSPDRLFKTPFRPAWKWSLAKGYTDKKRKENKTLVIYAYFYK